MDVRAFGSWMSAAKCLFFFQDFEALTEVLGRDTRANGPRMSEGYPSQKLPLWAEFSFSNIYLSIILKPHRPKHLNNFRPRFPTLFLSSGSGSFPDAFVTCFNIIQLLPMVVCLFSFLVLGFFCFLEQTLWCGFRMILTYAILTSCFANQMLKTIFPGP